MLNCTVISADNYRLNLSNNEKLFKIANIDGLNPTKTNIFSSDIYTVIGSTFNYAKDDTRNIVINLFLGDDTKSAKNEILKAFSNRKEITLEFDNRYSIKGYVESIDYNFFSNSIACQISIICLYPYFKSLETTQYILSNISNLLTFPFSAPPVGIPFGEIATTSKNVYNYSNIDSGLIMEVDFIGDVNTLTISNSTNGSYITINKSFVNGDKLNINTFDVVKTFTLNGESITNYISIGDTFLYLSTGNNKISLLTTSGSTNFTIEMSLRTIYTGI